MARSRIVIYGVTGSGKTTLGRTLAQELGLTHIELDSLYHGPNWTPATQEEFLGKVRAMLDGSPQGWVADGNYRAVRPFLLAQADTAIWLRLPWRVSYVRMLKRTLTRMLLRVELWNGNRETLRNMLLDKESLLLWGIRQHRPTLDKIRAALAEVPHSADVFEVRSAGEVEDLIRRFAAERAAELEAAS